MTQNASRTIIGIMSAMQEELCSLQASLDNSRETRVGDRTFIEGQLAGIDVVLVFSRWGKVASSITATTLITYFNVSHILFTGVAGAVDERLNIGDIVIGDKCFQHDLDPSPLFPKHTIPLTDKKFVFCSSEWVYVAKNIAQSFASNISQVIDVNTLMSFGITSPKAHVGIIASGDQFVSSVKQTRTISKETPGTLAVEMEGAAVAQVCEENDVPFVIFRVISDKANHKSHIDFIAFIQEIAAQYSLHLVTSLIKTKILSRDI